MREDQLRREVAGRLSGVTAHLPTSALGRPARLIAGLGGAGAQSLGRALRHRVGLARAPDLGPELSVVASLGQLKGVAMKIGQLLGYVDVGLPANLRWALSVLHARAQPLAPDRIRAVLEAELGHAGRELARTMEPAPLSVASLGQVHRATLPDGTAVAVKVGHPGISDTIARDFGPATLTSRLASRLFPRMHLDALVSEVQARVLEECDYALEARRQERFAALFAGHPTIVVPAVHRAFCSSRVLTTTFCEGLHLEEHLASEPTVEQRQRAGEALFDFYLGALFQHGLYNCDPHPGNYLFMRDGRLAIVDYGSVREFPPGFVARLAALTQAMGSDDRDGIDRGLLDLGITSAAGAAGGDVAAHWLLRALYGPLLRDEIAAFDPRSGVALREVLRRWRRARGLALPGELVFLLRTSLGLSSVLARLGARENWYRRLQALLATPVTGGAEPTTTEAPAASVVADASAEAVPGRIADAVAEPIADATAEPIVDTVAEPIADAVAEPIVDAVAEPIAGAVAEPIADGPAAYDLVLIHPGASQITLIRELRELTGLALRDVKYLIDACPQIVKQSVPASEARALRLRLESAGARIELRPAALRPAPHNQR